MTTTLDGPYSIHGLTIGVPAATGITSTVIDTNGSSLTIGAGGLTLASATDGTNPNASALSIGGTGPVSLAASQSWANNNDSMLLAVSADQRGFRPHYADP